MHFGKNTYMIHPPMLLRFVINRKTMLIAVDFCLGKRDHSLALEKHTISLLPRTSPKPNL